MVMAMSERAQRIEPFYVMKILQQAQQLESRGQSIIHMEIGEPDFPSAEMIIRAGKQALDNQYTHYTPANGLPELRAAIADSYSDQAIIDPGRIVVTPGASGALQLVMALLLDPGDGIMLADPGYPCNRHIASLFSAQIQSVAVNEKTDYQLTAELVEKNWQENTRLVLIASPSNPTGTLIPQQELSAIYQLVQKKGASLVVDEIYHSLVYDQQVASALSQGEQVFVINSFSKYYGMTGWRVGWLVMPEGYIESANRLAQNMFLAAPTLSQHAALAALSEETGVELKRRRDIFHQRRDILLPLIEQAGFRVKTVPAGAFYIYADCSAISDDSMKLCDTLLHQAGVAITPGADFGSNKSASYVRFSYANTVENLQEGMRRIQQWLNETK
ncbi:MAG: aminotransferase class I/II-fold pyridoxal phosphate-dependent enzyme [Gammaproteobacteria bacterium]|nr:aminotransferase class I/II-fold pyridoxal phosphate-dependent enzyme [Gammaproteobacteria bacterium]